jgi:hypothetical protein
MAIGTRISGVVVGREIRRLDAGPAFKLLSNSLASRTGVEPVSPP